MANTSFNNPFGNISFVNASPYYTDIKSATFSNPYHCDYDGYVFIVGVANGDVTFNLNSVYLSERIHNNSTDYRVVYVRKGMNVWFGSSSSAESTPSFARYFPIK